MHIKNYKQNKSLTNRSKSGKSAVSVTFLFKKNFGTFFKNFFNGFEMSVKFCVFDTHIEVLKENLSFDHTSNFSKL